MKYIVEVDSIRHDIDVDDSCAFTGTDAVATLGSPDGSPVRLLRIGDRVVRVLVRRGERRGNYVLDINGHRYTVEAMDERTRTIRDMTAQASAVSGPAPLKAPMPGLIIRINVAVGDQVQSGQGVVVMEAMKMENELRASASGVVTAIHVTPGTVVEKGTVLVELAE